MEKYSKWRDEGTGLHPFLPCTPLNKEHSLSWYLIKVIGFIIGIAKIPFIFVILIWMVVMSGLSTILMPIPFLHRLFRRYTEFLGSRALLFLFGFFNVQSRVIRLQQQKNTPINTTSFNSGDVIVCNHTSYIDILYLSFKCSPIFAFGPNTYTKSVPIQGIVNIRTNIISALLESINDPIRQPEQCIPIHEAIEIAQRYHAPLVVFPEGTTTNGKTLLSFVAPIFDGFQLNKLPTFRVIGIKYEYEDFSPTFTVGSIVKHSLQLCCQLSNNLEGRVLSASESQDINTAAQIQDNTPNEWRLSNQISTVLAAVLRIRKARLNAKDKREFMDYWYSHKKTY